MSIRPPADIVLDVAMAADPAKAAAAARKLSAGASDVSFAAALADRTATGSTPTETLAALSSKRFGQTAAPTDASGAMPKALRDLETFFLRTAFDGMLPAGSHVSGPAGAGAGVWKSMLAEALANQIAGSGGLHLLDSRAGAPARDGLPSTARGTSV